MSIQFVNSQESTVFMIFVLAPMCIFFLSEARLHRARWSVNNGIAGPYYPLVVERTVARLVGGFNDGRVNYRALSRQISYLSMVLMLFLLHIVFGINILLSLAVSIIVIPLITVVAQHFLIQKALHQRPRAVIYPDHVEEE